MMGRDVAQRCYLYRAYDRCERLLYVGITDNFVQRLGAHRRWAPWWDAMTSFTVDVHPDRGAAIEAEALAIVREGPAHNDAWPAVWHTAATLTSGRNPVESVAALLVEVHALRAKRGNAMTDSDWPDLPDIDPSDPRIQLGGPDGHERTRRMLTDAAAGDCDSEELMARVLRSAESTVGGWDQDGGDGWDAPVVEYPER